MLALHGAKPIPEYDSSKEKHWGRRKLKPPESIHYLSRGARIGACLRRPTGTAVAFSILRQDIDFAKLLLKLLDTPDAIRVSGSISVCRLARPAIPARYDRNRD